MGNSFHEVEPERFDKIFTFQADDTAKKTRRMRTKRNVFPNLRGPTWFWIFVLGDPSRWSKVSFQSHGLFRPRNSVALGQVTLARQLERRRLTVEGRKALVGIKNSRSRLIYRNGTFHGGRNATSDPGLSLFHESERERWEREATCWRKRERRSDD